MEPSKLELLKLILKYFDDGKYVQIVIALGIINLPWFIGFIGEWRAKRKIESLYKVLVSNKDDEIERQAKRIKDLENQTLKKKRA